MATTAIVAEILIVGLEASAWLTLLVLTIFGTGWIDVGVLEGWQALVTIVVLAGAYVLGILVDRAADSAHKALEGRRPGRVVDKPASIATMRLAAMQVSGVATFVDYQRSRLRIARATVLNLVLALPAVVLFLASRTSAGATVIAVAALVLAAAATLAHLAYRRIEVAYVSRLSDAYALVKKLPKPDLAAAIPWRLDDGELEILLVRTTGGEYWTLPKGHRRRGETLPEAAARETREEAGAEGRLDGRRMGVYRYPSGSRPGRRKDHRVAAFLLEVRREGLERTAEEEKRERRWFDLDGATAALAEGRDEPYANEVAEVLETAASRVARDD